jgi:hypothetical protein
MSDHGLSPEEIKKNHEESFLRKLIESPFLLLAISTLIMIGSYTIWGWVDLNKIPAFIPPK